MVDVLKLQVAELAQVAGRRARVLQVAATNHHAARLLLKKAAVWAAGGKRRVIGQSRARADQDSVAL